MSKPMKLPPGDRPIVHPAIVYTRFTEKFSAEINGHVVEGRFYDLAQAVGMSLQFISSDPWVILKLGSPITANLVGVPNTQRVKRSVALFTKTSKMPGPSFALPAGPPAFGGTCQASALGDDVDASRQKTELYLIKAKKYHEPSPHIVPDAPSPEMGILPGIEPSYYGDAKYICRRCYALGGNYRYATKQMNDMLHLAWCRYELSRGGPERLATLLAYAIQHHNTMRRVGFQPYFRIHDAGDFFSDEYLEAWVLCASMMKHIRFWAPSRQWVFGRWADLYRSAMSRVHNAGGWLVIRPSTLRTREPIVDVHGLFAGAGTGVDLVDPCVWRCPVYDKLVERIGPNGTVKMEEASSCLEAQCTMCWDINMPVTYGEH